MIKKIILALAVLVFSSPAFALTGKVVGVADGDTIRVLDDNNVQHRIRLASIDAPEKKQEFGSVAKTRMSELVFGKIVDVQEDVVDRYGRTVGLVTVNGLNVNAEMVKEGLAWVYVSYVNKRDRWFITLEQTARANQIGLWSHSDPTPPWQFRKSKTK
jgi:endonuclease YncB( thermonuclease family)